MTRVFNFSAGPAVLPEPVLRQAAAEMLDWHGSGMSVMEMSHRGKEFIAIHAEAEALLRELLAIPANYKVLFLQGGAIGENAIVPMNMLRGKAERRLHRHRRVVEEVDQGGEEVRQGQRRRERRGEPLHQHPAARRPGSSTRTRPTCTSAPTRRSAASSTTSRPTSATCRWSPTCRATSCRGRSTSSKYGLIYGGAQKNIGPAGLTIVIVRDDLIGQALPVTPSAFDYKQQADNDSMLNTPPTYAIYIAGLVFKWLQGAGRPGGDGRAQPRQGEAAVRLPRPQRLLQQPGRARRPLADERAVHAARTRRSTTPFLKGAEARGMVQLKGHRSVGGMRASIYNAMPVEGVQALVDYMTEFEAKHG